MTKMKDHCLNLAALFGLLQWSEVSAGSGDINLMVVGDWGGVPFPPYSTPGQRAVAASMGRVATDISASAVLALGDNFYFDGIRTDATNYRFENTWNSVYSDPSLQVPWYLIAGNHDHYGNVTAQLEFTDVSERWNFPALYHQKSFASDDSLLTLDVVFIDTVDLAGASMITDENDPRYYDKLPYRPKAAAATQWDWIEEQLKASTADFLIVAGHYPMYSVCEHGATSNLIENLRPLLIQYGAHYMAGHDHCMVSTTDENNLLYIVTGAGNTCCTKADRYDEVPPDYLDWYVSRENKPKTNPRLIGGFSSLTATKDGVKIMFYDQEGNELYATQSVPPRAKATAK
mmetsp:Transcript_23959/g.40750  ORF Transcript_23959/g.40750 Transcript_23959/m.40750 type:complete len:345 (+) Transcript_23959:19-1053(+)